MPRDALLRAAVGSAPRSRCGGAAAIAACEGRAPAGACGRSGGQKWCLFVLSIGPRPNQTVPLPASLGPVGAEVRPLSVTPAACGEHEHPRDVSRADGVVFRVRRVVFAPTEVSRGVCSGCGRWVDTKQNVL
jgi:hypothetical protein